MWRSLVILLVVLAGATAPASAAAAQGNDDQWWYVQWRMDEVRPITDGTGVTVAVLDSGVDASLPDLSGAVVPGTNVIDGGGDGRTDLDDPGHGTVMATLIAGRGGSHGLPGVAPGATILPVTVSTGDSVESELAVDWFEQAIRYATDNGADIISMSQAARGSLQDEDGCPAALAEAVRYAASQDVIVVAGSGNSEATASFFPGNCPGVLTVGATDQQLEPWADSHRSEYVDVTGPGVDNLLVARDGRLFQGSGTSNATALVSGAIALVRAAFPDASADEILARVIHTARDIGAGGWDEATGYGIVRPFQALTGEVPGDAPNPVWDGLDDPAATPTPSGTTGPDPGAAPDPDGSDGSLPVAILLAGGIGLLLLLAVGGTLALVIARNRRPEQRPPL